ncbi:MAG: FKBP-type peptidyl-prolyl cis-trans isomerase [Brumimicrobium sp.]
MRYFLFVITALFLLSCSTYSDNDKKQFEKEIENYIDSTGVEMQRAENGLYYNIIEEGKGQPIRMTDQVTFYYEGQFLDGNSFQTIPKEEALTFNVRELIIGWQDALMLIGQGGEIEVIIPPHLGYGTKKTELIPANTILKYHLKVLEVR